MLIENVLKYTGFYLIVLTNTSKVTPGRGGGKEDEKPYSNNNSKNNLEKLGENLKKISGKVP